MTGPEISWRGWPAEMLPDVLDPHDFRDTYDGTEDDPESFKRGVFFQVDPEPECICPTEGPDECGNYDLVEVEDCPRHG